METTDSNFAHLNPIFTSPVEYSYVQDRTNITGLYIENKFECVGKNCDYLIYRGPEFEDVSNFSVLPLKNSPEGGSLSFCKDFFVGEALFCKRLYNFIFTVEYKVRGSPSEVPRIVQPDSTRENGYEVFDTKGRLARFYDKEGSFKLYSGQTPFVVYCPGDACIDLTLKISCQLKGKDPFILGTKCIRLCNGTKISAYEVVPGVQNGTLKRIVSPRLLAYNERINEELRKRVYKPCNPVVPNRIMGTGPTVGGRLLLTNNSAQMLQQYNEVATGCDNGNIMLLLEGDKTNKGIVVGSTLPNTQNTTSSTSLAFSWEGFNYDNLNCEFTFNMGIYYGDVSVNTGAVTKCPARLRIYYNDDKGNSAVDIESRIAGQVYLQIVTFDQTVSLKTISRPANQNKVIFHVEVYDLYYYSLFTKERVSPRLIQGTIDHKVTYF